MTENKEGLNRSVQFSFISVAPIHNNSHLKVLYDIRKIPQESQDSLSASTWQQREGSCLLRLQRLILNHGHNILLNETAYELL